MKRERDVDAPSGLLAFLFASWPESKKKQIRTWLKVGAVTVNGRPVTRFDHRLRRGDVGLHDRELRHALWLGPPGPRVARNAGVEPEDDALGRLPQLVRAPADDEHDASRIAGRRRQRREDRVQRRPREVPRRIARRSEGGIVGRQQVGRPFLDPLAPRGRRGFGRAAVSLVMCPRARGRQRARQILHQPIFQLCSAHARHGSPPPCV